MRQLLPARASTRRNARRTALHLAIGVLACATPAWAAQESSAPERPQPADAEKAGDPAAPGSDAGATQDETPEQPLTRVAPVVVEQEQPPSSPRAELFARDFDEALWRTKLASQDLTEREHDFDDLLRRARLDPYARVFLEKLAGDGDVELAWTAKLALRELGKPALPLVGPDASSQAQQEFVQLYREMIGSSPDLLFMTKRDPRLRVVQIDGDDAGASVPKRVQAVRSVQLQQGADGAKIIVTDSVKGKESTHTFEGPSIEAILAENESLRRDLSLSAKQLPEAFDMRMSVPRVEPQQQGLLDPFAYGQHSDEVGDRSKWIPAGDDAVPYFSPAGRKVTVRTDVLGVVSMAIEPDEAKTRNVKTGLVVLRVERGTIADLMDIRTGDVLLKMGGKPLLRPQDITDAMDARGRQDPVSVVWLNELDQLMTSTWTPDPPAPAQGAAPSAPADGAQPGGSGTGAGSGGG